jgi:hypothetical protein
MRPALPRNYVEWIESHGGWQGDLGDELGYVELWDIPTIQESWDLYEMGRYLSDRWFPFGSDGGNEMLCFNLTSGGDRVYWMPFVGMADKEAMPRYDSFEIIAARVEALRAS